MSRILALYPIGVAVLVLALPVLAPRSGPLALASILSPHLTLAALALVPIAIALRRARWLNVALLLLAAVALLRFGGEWASLPPPADEYDDVLQAATWNLELGARAGADAVDGLRELDVDVIALQELGPDHADAIAASPNLRARFPAQELHPDPGVFGIGLLSRDPILRAEHATDPSLIEALLEVGGRQITLITAHPLPGRIAMAGPLPIAFDPTERDRALGAIRARVDAALGRGESVVVLGDFNVSPDEPGYRDLVAGLHDAHSEVGQGPGWTWRPSRFEGAGVGLLRIDLALSGPNLPPVAAREHCGLPGDHCQLEAWFSLGQANLGQQSFQLLLPGHDPIKALPVSILDTTGLVADANAAIEPFADPDGAHAVPGAPERMRITWIGGACDRGVTARVTRSGSDVLVTIDTFVPGDGGCTLEGINRTFELRLVRAVDPARIRVVSS